MYVRVRLRSFQYIPERSIVLPEQLTYTFGRACGRFVYTLRALSALPATGLSMTLTYSQNGVMCPLTV